MLCTGAGKKARCTITKCQLVSLSLVSLCCSTPPSQRTDLFSVSFALSHCPAEFLSNNPHPKSPHSWIPPSDPRELTIGKKPSSFANIKRATASGLNQLTEPQELSGIDSDLTTKQRRVSLHAIKGGGLLFIPGTRSDVLLLPNMKMSVSCLLSPVLYRHMSEIMMKA